MTTINAKNINCETLNCINNRNTTFSKVIKCTFNNISSSDNFLKNAAFFQMMCPANLYIVGIAVYITVNSIVVATDANSDTIMNVADGTNSVVGTATSITIGSAPGAAGVVIATDDSERTNGTLISGDINANGHLSTQDRLLTGVIYHDANGENDGLGDAALTITDLDKVVLYIELMGFRAPE
tara:strand:- start:320 stop:868 length:549 start_codon:yes stop_codon:yes gene_type:complete